MTQFLFYEVETKLSTELRQNMFLFSVSRSLQLSGANHRSYLKTGNFHFSFLPISGFELPFFIIIHFELSCMINKFSPSADISKESVRGNLRMKEMSLPTRNPS